MSSNDVVSMKQLERRTEEAYAQVSSLRAEIRYVDDEAHGLRNLILIPSPFLIGFTISIFFFAPWFAAFGPLLAYMFLLSVGVQRLYGMRTQDLPSLRAQERRALTLATEALQRQEERRVMELWDPQGYAKIEAERVRRAKKREAEQVWEEAFNLGLKERNFYQWL